jgi:hypothetical protein
MRSALGRGASLPRELPDSALPKDKPIVDLPMF